MKRSAPFAMFNLFDAPTGVSCVARRDVSNSPLQSLTLLNDPAFIEAAQALGREIATSPSSPKEKAMALFRRVLTRQPNDKEQEFVLAFYERQRKRLNEGEIEAEKLAGEKTDDAVERAAWTAVARAILNLDEAITKE